MKKFLLSILILSFLCSPARADELSELKSMFKDMQIQMQKMALRIQQLEEEKRSRRSAHKEEIQDLQTRIDDLEQAPSSGVAKVLSNLNPEISVIGDFIYKTTDEPDGEGDNRFNMREVELAFSANVDTWARGDFWVAIENEDGETEVVLEEGYLTLLETPIPNLQGRFGKFRPYFGKANKMHLHALPWTTYPNVIQNYFGEEGFSEAGVSLSYLIPNPADIFSELTFEAFNNGSTVFGGDEEGSTIYLGHWKNFFDITDETTLEVGGSYAIGENGNEGGARTQISGVDVTLNTEVFDQRRTTSHTELLFSNYEQAFDEEDINSWGMFSSLEQQVADRWWIFGRYDFSQLPDSSETDTHAYSTGLTFAQSEYVFWRVMFTHTDHEDMEEDTNEVWLQMDFGIGPHRPHQYR